VVSHIEPAGETRPTTLASTKDSDNIKAILARIPELQEPSKAPQNVEIRCCGSELSLSFRCTLPGSTSIKEAHDFTEKIERSLRSQLPNLGRIMARIEPAD
jgi:divalent metal cation (Fe/Co/Zn/Cd) transporter